MRILFEFVMIFIAATLLMFLFLKGYSSHRRMVKRMSEFLPKTAVEHIAGKQEKRQSLLKRLFYFVANTFKNVQFSEKTERVLLQSGSKLKPEEFFAGRIFVGVGLGMSGSLLGVPWWICIIIALIGFSIPVSLMERKRKKRLKLSSYQLIDVLGMMANSMRAGFSFMQAMQLVGKEVPKPIGPEFERVVRQAGLGIPLEEIFEELVERLPNHDLEVVVQAILAQRKSGGNLAELLETMEETIRGRVRIFEELNTLTAQGKMSSWIITCLPIGLGLYLTLVSKDYFGPMLHHPLGWTMLIFCVVSNFIGWLLIRKIIRIEV